MIALWLETRWVQERGPRPHRPHLRTPRPRRAPAGDGRLDTQRRPAPAGLRAERARRCALCGGSELAVADGLREALPPAGGHAQLPAVGIFGVANRDRATDA